MTVTAQKNRKVYLMKDKAKQTETQAYIFKLDVS